MTKYFVNFVICNQDGDLEGKCDVVVAPKGANQSDILNSLLTGIWPEAEYVMKFEPHV